MELVNNAQAVREALEGASAAALGGIGAAWARRAKEKVLGEWGEGLRESIAFEVEGDVVTVGSPLDVAAYVELGTRSRYEQPPEWMENRAQRGTKVPEGAERWVYRDEDGSLKVGGPREATPFIRPALEEGIEEYRGILEDALRG